MASTKTEQMNISLTPVLAGFVRSAVKTGLYNNASEVMREALRILKQETDRKSLHTQPMEDLVETERRIARSAAAVERGDFQDYDAQGLRDLGRTITRSARQNTGGTKKRA